MVSLKTFSQHLLAYARFVRLTFLVCSFLTLTILSTSPAAAQANCDPATAPPPTSTNYQCCVGSQNVAYFNAHRNECLAATGYQYSGNGNAPINDIKVLNESNNTTNGVGTTNKGSFVSNPSVFKQAGTTVTPIGGDGVLENIFAGIAKNVAMYKTQTVDAQGNPVVYYSPGAIGTTINLTAKVLEKSPASSIEYIAYLKDSIQRPFGVQPAYAQGLGFSSLSPILGLWKIFRNLAYFFFVIIFLVIGFLIMFRSKLGGQAAVTVQQALPKIVVSLLLVTFSYAIAGLLIDLMYIIIYLMIGIFSIGNSGQLSFQSLFSIAFEKNIFENGISFITQGVAGNVAGAIGSVVVNILNFDQGILASAQGLIQGGVSIIAFLVIAIAILVNLFRIFFELIRTYAMIFILVIFSPIQLLIGALPGQNTFGGWVKALMENLIVFPVLILLIFIANWFAFGPALQANGGLGGFSAPQLGSNQGAGAPIAFALIQFGILALIPKAMEIAKGAVSGKLNLDVGKAMGEFANKGWAGGEVIPGLGFTKIGARSLMPDKVANAIPFGFGEATPYRTHGKETGLERLLIGSRADRQKEVEYQRQAALFGKNVKLRQGGLARWLQDKNRAKSAAEQQSQAGAASDTL